MEKGGLWLILYSGLVVPLSLLTACLLPFLAGVPFSQFNAFGRAAAPEPDPLPQQKQRWQQCSTSLSFSTSPPASNPSTTASCGGRPLPGQNPLCNSCQGISSAGQGPCLQYSTSLTLCLPIHPSAFPHTGMSVRVVTSAPLCL